MKPIANYQAIYTAEGLKHVYTFRDAPYSVYLSHPLGKFVETFTVNGFNQDKIELKEPRYLTNQEVRAGVAHIKEFSGVKLFTPELCIFALCYPQVPHRKFYTSLYNYRANCDEFPTYDKALHIMFVDSLVSNMVSTFDITTTWGTAKDTRNFQPDFSKGFYDRNNSVLYVLDEDTTLDAYPVLLISAWYAVAWGYRMLNTNSKFVNRCLHIEFVTVLNFLLKVPDYHRLVLNFYFSGLSSSEYFQTNKAALDYMIEDIASLGINTPPRKA